VGGGAPPVGLAVREARGVLVVLDVDVARLFGVLTVRLDEQVRRNAARFGGDFAFRLLVGA
jgi:hypothetical protein